MLGTKTQRRMLNLRSSKAIFELQELLWEEECKEVLTKRFWILIESFSLYTSHIFTLPLVLEKVFPPVMGIFDIQLPQVHVGAEKGMLLLHHISGNHKFP